MRLTPVIAFAALFWSTASLAQMPIPDAAAPDPARLFRSQCATCHSLKASDKPRQGPNLENVYGRKIGGVDDYKYTAGYRESDKVWDETTLDQYLANPQAMFPGSTMAYRQPKPDIRKVLIAFLKGQS